MRLFYRTLPPGRNSYKLVPWDVVRCEMTPQDLQRAVLISERSVQRVLWVAAMGGNVIGRYNHLRHILTCVLCH